MSVQHPVISYDVAISYQDDLLCQAETKRLMSTAESRGSSLLSGLTQRAGEALVHLGERLQTTRRQANEVELAASVGALRLSR